MDESKTYCVVVEVVNRYEVYVKAESYHDAACKAENNSIDHIEQECDLVSSAMGILYVKDK
jgi:hypothetical protein